MKISNGYLYAHCTSNITNILNRNGKKIHTSITCLYCLNHEFTLQFALSYFIYTYKPLIYVNLFLTRKVAKLKDMYNCKVSASHSNLRNNFKFCVFHIIFESANHSAILLCWTRRYILRKSSPTCIPFRPRKLLSFLCKLII